MKIKKYIKRIYKKWRRNKDIKAGLQYHLNEKDFSSLPKLTDEQVSMIKSFWGMYPITIELKFWQYYYKKIGKFDYRYVPDDVWSNYICPYFNDVMYARTTDNKSLYDMMIRNIKMPETVLRIVDNRLLDRDYNSVHIKEINSIVHKYDSLIIKPSVLVSGGKGIKIYNRENYMQLIQDLSLYDNAVVQVFLTQSECLNNLNPSCINTIRISSIMYKDGTVNIPSAMLRLGVKGSKVDNASAGGIFVGIDIESGRLKKYAQARTGQMAQAKYIEHPDSKVVFDGYYICGFDKIKDIIYKNAKYFPKTRLIGWDFCLDEENNPILVELNLEGHGLESLQIANGAYFNDDIKKVLDEIEWDKVKDYDFFHKY